MPRALGGRVGIATSSEVRFAKQARRQVPVPPICLTESFDGLDDGSGGGSGGTFFGHIAATPDSAPLSVTGDIDIRVYMTLSTWSPASEHQLVSKRNGPSFQGYQFRIIGGGSGGTPTIGWDDAGGSSHSATATADLGDFADDSTHWVRVTLDVDNGAAGRDANFYTSDDGVTWTQVGSTVTQAGTTSIKNTADDVWVGGFSNADSVLHNVEILNGIGGTLVGNPDFAAQAVGTTSFTDGHGNTWTLTGDAEIIGPPGAPWLGPDQVWTEYHRALTSGFGDSVSTQGTNGSLTAAQACIRVVSDSALMRAPDDSELPGGSTQWGLVRGTVYTPVPVTAQSDQRVSARIAVPGPGIFVGSPGDGWTLSLGARISQVDTTNSGQFVGFTAQIQEVVNFPATVVRSANVFVGYVSGGIQFTTNLGLVTGLTFASGREFAVTVTGTQSGGDLTVIVELGGATIITLTNSDFTPWAGLLPDDGFAAGFNMEALRDPWVHATMDNVLGIANWSVCPA